MMTMNSMMTMDDDDDDVVWMMVGLEGSLFCAHKILCWPTQNFV